MAEWQRICVRVRQVCKSRILVGFETTPVPGGRTVEEAYSLLRWPQQGYASFKVIIFQKTGETRRKKNIIWLKLAYELATKCTRWSYDKLKVRHCGENRLESSQTFSCVLAEKCLFWLLFSAMLRH